MKSDELIEAAAAALERNRQKVLDSAWRPLKCAVPWTPAEEPGYRERNPQLEAMIDAATENGLAWRAIEAMNAEAKRRADEVETPVGGNVVPLRK